MCTSCSSRRTPSKRPGAGQAVGGSAADRCCPAFGIAPLPGGRRGQLGGWSPGHWQGVLRLEVTRWHGSLWSLWAACTTGCASATMAMCRRQRRAQGCARMPDATVLCYVTGPSQQSCWSQGQEPAQAGRVLPAPGWRETPAAGGEAMACDRPRQGGS